MRRSVIIVAALLALAAVLVGGPSLLTSPTTSEIAPETEVDPEADIVRPTGGETGIWPYLNSRRAFEKRSPINVIVLGDTDDVIRILRATDEGDWEPTDEEREEAVSETHAVFGANGTDGVEDSEDGLAIGSTNVDWRPTTGATRYAYVDPGPDRPGQWVNETAQFHDGTYYGSRFHIRLYASPNPDEPWVAMQTHSEHFDWFTLRHRVAGSQAAQVHLERDLMALPRVDTREDVRRVYLDNANSSDADGWATVVELALLGVVGLALTRRSVRGIGGGSLSWGRGEFGTPDRLPLAVATDRVDDRHLLLAGSIIAVIIGVRFGGITLERTDWFSMHTIAALLYPFVGLGLPALTYAIASGLERRLDASIVTSGAFAVAIWLDYGLLGVTSLPIGLVAQRMIVVVSLGLIAGGSARRATRETRANGLLIAGVLLWLVILVGTLFGYL